MFGWFIAASSAVKFAVVSAGVLVLGTVVAIPTAVITIAVVEHNQSLSTPEVVSISTPSATEVGPTESSSPTPSVADTATPSVVPKNTVPSPKQAIEAEAPAAVVAPPVQVPVPSAPTSFALGGRGCSGDGTSASCGGDFTFTAPTVVGNGITGYQAAYSVNGGASWTYVTATASPNTAGAWSFHTNAIPTGSASPGGFIVGVRALNSSGSGPISNVATW